MTEQRITDKLGHRWPVTGLWCRGCGMPLNHVHRFTMTHPGCETPELLKPTQGGDS